MTDALLADDFAALTDGSALTIHRWLPGPAERIWRYLTEGDLRRQWLAAGEMTLTKGAPATLVWRNDDLSDADDSRPEGFPEEQRMETRVLAVDPMRSLTLAWGKGDVTFTLTPKGDRVLLTVVHRGLTDRAAQAMIGAGWHMHLDILASKTGGEKPGSFWSGWTRLRDAYAARLADQSR